MSAHELYSSRSAQSGRQWGFLRYRNRQLTELHRRHIARSKSSQCNSHGPCEPETTFPAALLDRLGVQHLRRPRDQEDRMDQVDQVDQVDRLRLSHQEGRPVQVELRRNPPGQWLK